ILIVISVALILIQAYLVNMNIRTMDIDAQDTITLMKGLFLGLIILFLGIAIYLRSRFGAVEPEEPETPDETPENKEKKLSKVT
ncbi:MAG: hypothetical protein ACLFQV_04855, partial [Vulcanimicrobiota bacterium]